MNRHIQITALCDELRSGTCHCGHGKLPGKTFCISCYHRLPIPMRQALYARIGNGYEEARVTAFQYLQARQNQTGGTMIGSSVTAPTTREESR